MASNNEDQPVTGDLEKAAAAPVKDDAEEDEYPPFAKVVLIMTALYLAMFLVALVSLSTSKSRISADRNRTEQFSERPFQRLLMISIQSTMLVGTQARTSLRSVRFNSSMADCIRSIPANGSFSAPFFCSKSEYANPQHFPFCSC
jgi:hypothetical protein